MGKGWCRYGDQVLELLGLAEKSGRGKKKNLEEGEKRNSEKWQWRQMANEEFQPAWGLLVLI